MDGLTPAALGYPGGLSSSRAARQDRGERDSAHAETTDRPVTAAIRRRLDMTDEAASALTPVSRETGRRASMRYVDLLLEWQATINLVAPSTLPTLWTRHIADSLQLLLLAPARQDAGSISAAAAAFRAWSWLLHGERRRAPTCTLSRATRKKAAFLREAVRSTARAGDGPLRAGIEDRRGSNRPPQPDMRHRAGRSALVTSSSSASRSRCLQAGRKRAVSSRAKM